ncbi:MAG: DUF2520 domain-containing protein [Rikenellaceae bacterium]|nr:DUF2520 domain-containing protein [Rikenellaceae bacterium]
MKRVVVIGSGNVAEALAPAIARAEGYELVQLYARNRAAGERIARLAGCPYAGRPDGLAPADIYLLCVSDRAVEPLSRTLAFGDGIVAHTAGSVDLAALSPAIRHRAVLYPLQTFTKGRPADFTDIPLFVEASDPNTLAAIGQLARALSSRVQELGSARRAVLHLAAVFASNFANHMYTLGEEVLREADIPFDALGPLILETARKAVESGSPRRSQTGPAVRNDFQTRTRQREMLAAHPELERIYTNLSNSIWETSKKI